MVCVLIAEDDEDVGMFLSVRLGQEGHESGVVRVQDAAAALSRAGCRWDALVLRYPWIAVVPAVRHAHPKLRIVVLWPDRDPPTSGLPGVDAVLGRTHPPSALTAALLA